MLKGKYSTLTVDLKSEGNVISVNGHKANKDELFIHVMSYSDGFHDVCLCYIEGEKALGSTGWDIIHDSELDIIVNSLKDITGIGTVKVEKL